MTELPPGSISACIVVQNEEAVIERCLESLDGVVEEIVLVHSGGCEDRTLEIAARHGCRIFEGEDAGHGERNTPLAYQYARGEWLLNVDADEFLSAELRSGLRALTRDPDTDGYAFRWRLWNGSRYVTDRGPYKLVLFRRSKTRMVGVIHAAERVDGRVREVPLELEHRPPYNRPGLRPIVSKMRRWIPIEAREYTSDLSDVPRFNCPGELRWSRRRRIANWLSPLYWLPAGVHTFVYVMRCERDHLSLGERLRYAAIHAVHRSLVTLQVARLMYLRR